MTHFIVLILAEVFHFDYHYQFFGTNKIQSVIIRRVFRFLRWDDVEGP